MKTKHTIAFLAFTFLAVSCGSEEKKPIAGNPPIPVKVSTINENSNRPFLTASGTIQAVKSANLSTRMMGFITNTPVNVGDYVKTGQLLVAINNSDLQAKLSQVNAGISEATAAFTNAEKDYNRFKNLFAENSASQKEFDDITAHYNMAKARLEGAKQMKNEVDAQFAYANIRAPFDGVVTGKFIKNGDMANPGMPLIAIETPGKFEVVASVPESDISKINSGTPVNILVKSIGKAVEGKVTEVSSSAKNTGGQYMVKVALDKTDASILSGMFVTVQFPIKAQEKSEMVLIPNEVLVTKGQLSGIYTLSESHTALLRWLRLGRTFGDQVEVLSGLSSNERYIISADGKLFNGAKVIPSPAP
ncbi:Efflux pump periplasmic linker BepF [Mariniflexile rhizosphaerae]|uniref:efflux RND transporter periplasmic adaptor subunit n=1 Tax=unclassified Mariniflexile TaxID=2643887 RepID=UPI000CBDBEC4|nr:efflux RND transporter periplasmic adaptor subunit [Mariniflexile sp. TRM1-10]AXP79694.1 Efflux pump periplasmic linker BepF [Mariniflexile sp. TRM1-10]PLB18988.1 MAG: putative Co/Zn/Cd efflux system membrane fusion protein [Flavobacteriaceae bacterium FS1-H7996/R]